jgi:protein SCO1
LPSPAFLSWRRERSAPRCDPATIDALLGELGFSYRAVAGGFDHPTQTTILDRDGKVYRHVYGEAFPLRMFMEPMKDVI